MLSPTRTYPRCLVRRAKRPWLQPSPASSSLPFKPQTPPTAGPTVPAPQPVQSPPAKPLNCGCRPLLLCLGRKNRAPSRPRDSKGRLPAAEQRHPARLLPTGTSDSPADHGPRDTVPPPGSIHTHATRGRSRFSIDRPPRTAPGSRPGRTSG